MNRAYNIQCGLPSQAYVGKLWQALENAGSGLKHKGLRLESQGPLQMGTRMVSRMGYQDTLRTIAGKKWFSDVRTLITKITIYMVGAASQFANAGLTLETLSKTLASAKKDGVLSASKLMGTIRLKTVSGFHLNTKQRTGVSGIIPRKAKSELVMHSVRGS